MTLTYNIICIYKVFIAYLANVKHGVPPEGWEERNKLSDEYPATQEWGQPTQQLRIRETTNQIARRGIGGKMGWLQLCLLH